MYAHYALPAPPSYSSSIFIQSLVILMVLNVSKGIYLIKKIIFQRYHQLHFYYSLRTSDLNYNNTFGNKKKTKRGFTRCQKDFTTTAHLGKKCGSARIIYSAFEFNTQN